MEARLHALQEFNRHPGRQPILKISPSMGSVPTAGCLPTDPTISRIAVGFSFHAFVPLYISCELPPR